MKQLMLSICFFAVLLFAGQVDTGLSEHNEQVMQESYQRLFDSLSVDFKDRSQLEYGKGIWETEDLIKEYGGGTIYASQDFIDLARVGRYDITYTMQGQDEFGQEITKSYTKTIMVSDTQKPVIKLKNSEISLTTGDSFDAASNIASVSDPVDGALRKADSLENGTYKITSDVNTSAAGNYTVKVEARDSNGNLQTASYKVVVKISTYNHTWNGVKLNPVLGTVYGPSGRETYYNLPMDGVIAIMRRMGNYDTYWIREDGVKMLGNYVMVAADLHIRPRGSLIETSLGMGIVCDTGAFALRDPYQLDIAVNW
ncbi:MAG: hypothetical protein IJI05_02335 [Erysipelotrichaceae bacterium]|nr:hypothetical protein [Erysipelotrichaceae bacterium]